MFLKITLRNLLKRKVFASINIFGLGIGIASCLMIYLFISDQTSYDTSYENSERIYRIVRSHGTEGDRSFSAAINYKFVELAKENMTSIEAITSFSPIREAKVVYQNTKIVDNNVFFADPYFLDIFSIETKKGKSENMLDRPFTAVLTSNMANKIFGHEEVLGESVEVNGKVYQVTGLVEELPKNSHFNFQMLLSLESSRSIYNPQMFEHWGNIWLYTYVKVKEGVSKRDFELAIDQLTADHGPEVLKSFGVDFSTQPIETIHLHSNIENELSQNGNYQAVQVLVAVAILVLIVASFNFINLTTARSAWRMKEVGIKKVLGIRKKELIKQFLGEALFVTFLALIFAYLIIALALPFFNQFSESSFTYLSLVKSFPSALFLATVVGLLAGSVPSVFLSSFAPVTVLKGRSNQGDSKFASWLRKSLIVTQFSIAIVLIIGTLVIYQQLEYLQEKDLGVTTEGVMVLPLKNKETRKTANTLLKEVSGLSEVKKASLLSDTPFEELNSWQTRPIGVEGPMQLINIMVVDENFIESLGVKINGEKRQDELMSNWSQQGRILVNEAFVKNFLIHDPIGHKIEFDHMEKPVEIAGVVKDFHFESLHKEIKPLILAYQETWLSKLAISFESEDKQAFNGQIKEIWNRVNPNDEFSNYYLEDIFNRLYEKERTTAKLVGLFSFIAIVIACLGLYGLASYVAESKLKELSVRKVLGATTKSLVSLQFNIFTKLIVVSAVIAIP